MALLRYFPDIQIHSLMCIPEAILLRDFPHYHHHYHLTRLVDVPLDDPESPPPSPLYPYLFAAYQKMIAEADLTKRERALITVPPYGTEVGESYVSAAATSRGETALTVCMTRLRGQLHTTFEDMDSYPDARLEELAVFMTKWYVRPRVEIDQWETSLEDPIDELITRFRQVCEDVEIRARDA
ncbi:hypothetical protein Tco_1093401 [Tanacetum coccineum]|uniref:Uncharacterized protein n=1 Tax=Tanacetum coccineum TaxID=301880 RepID=A0ABQ5IES9_9ASTR